MPGWSSGTRNSVIPCVLRLGVGAGAHPVPVGEVGRRGPRLLAVEPPAVAVARGLELHRRGVGAGVGFAVADGEVDVVTEDLRQELLLHLVGAVTQDRLADDADALADLRAAAGRERLVEEVLVDTVAFLAAPLGRPGDAEPALLRHLAHERAAVGVSAICAMFSRVTSKSTGSSLASRNCSTSSRKASCSGKIRNPCRCQPTDGSADGLGGWRGSAHVRKRQARWSRRAWSSAAAPQR